MSELDRKANTVFSGKVVRKDLVRKVKVGANVPVYVLEYLLGKYCASDDPAAIDVGLRVVNDTLARNYTGGLCVSTRDFGPAKSGRGTKVSPVPVGWPS